MHFLRIDSIQAKIFKTYPRKRLRTEFELIKRLDRFTEQKYFELEAKDRHLI